MRGPESSPATAALALAVSKSRAIRENSLEEGEKWMHMLDLAMGLGKAGKLGLGTQGLPLRCHRAVVLCPTSPMRPTCSCLLPGCEGTAGRGAWGILLHRGPHSLSLCCSHSQTLIPGLALSPPDLSGPCVAPLGRISRHSRDDVNSIQPFFYTVPLGKPSDHTAECWPDPPASQILGQGLLLLQLPNNGW